MTDLRGEGCEVDKLPRDGVQWRTFVLVVNLRILLPESQLITIQNSKIHRIQSRRK
jgi:hypothetical protein